VRPAQTAAIAGGLVVSAVSVLGAATAPAQDPPPTFRAAVDIVHVEVSVLDKDRKPVRGLTAADFTITEDGQPREIVAFSQVELPRARVEAIGAPEAAWTREVPSDVASNVVPAQGRLIVVLFEQLTDRQLGKLPIARRLARATIEAMAQGDLAAILFVGRFYNAKAIQDFTADKARLLEAIDQPLSLATVPSDSETHPCPLYAEMGEIADAVAAIRGRRKSIVYIGAPDVPDPYMCGPKAVEAVRKLRLANVTVHELNPAGLTTVGREVWRGHLADQTDGRTVTADNTPEVEVPAIVEESGSYYLLAFSAGTDGRYAGETHVIDVKVARPDLTVFARSGYQVGQTAKAMEAEARRTPLARAVEWTLPRTDLPMSISAAPFAVPGSDKAAVAVALRVQPARVTASDAEPLATDPGVETVNVVVAALDPVFAKVIGTLTQKADIPFPPGREEPEEYELLSRLSLAPGRYEIRAALDSSSGARASVHGMIDVPRFADEELSLSGLVVEVSPSTMAAPRSAFTGLLPLVPTARREFTTTDRVRVFFRVYRRDDAQSVPSVVVKVIDAQGTVVFEQQDQGPAEYEIAVPVEQLSPGRFLFEATASAGDRTATRRMPFVVTGRSADVPE
jgi:VWFA-related protein